MNTPKELSSFKLHEGISLLDNLTPPYSSTLMTNRPADWLTQTAQIGASSAVLEKQIAVRKPWELPIRIAPGTSIPFILCFTQYRLSFAELRKPSAIY